jgi:hypothetical protein
MIKIFFFRLDIPNPVVPRHINENLIEHFVKSTRQDAAQQLTEDTRYLKAKTVHMTGCRATTH